MTTLVLLASGIVWRARCHWLALDTHLNRHYFYRLNRCGLWCRVYVERGDSVEWVEVPDPLTGGTVAA